MTNTSSRRSFLKFSVALAPLGIVNQADAQETPPKDDLSLSAPPPDRPTTPDYKPGYFSPSEWSFVRAAVDRIIPKDEHGPGAVESGVAEYIDRQMQTPYADGALWYMQGPFLEAAPEFGYQSKLTPKEQYRLGIRAIDAHCMSEFKKTFAELTPAQQDDVLKRVEGGQIKSEEAPIRTFFSSFLLRHTQEGYFGDPMYGGNKDMGGWKMIAYPGVRAEYQDFVMDIAPYPYGPVSLHGQQG
jgi:gluconate 2-dehydrogenase gamma chain